MSKLLDPSEKAWLRRKHFLALGTIIGLSLGWFGLVYLSFYMNWLTGAISIITSIMGLLFWICLFNLELHPDIWED